MPFGEAPGIIAAGRVLMAEAAFKRKVPRTIQPQTAPSSSTLPWLPPQANQGIVLRPQFGQPGYGPRPPGHPPPSKKIKPAPSKTTKPSRKPSNYNIYMDVCTPPDEDDDEIGAMKKDEKEEDEKDFSVACAWPDEQVVEQTPLGISVKEEPVDENPLGDEEPVGSGTPPAGGSYNLTKAAKDEPVDEDPYDPYYMMVEMDMSGFLQI